MLFLSYCSAHPKRTFNVQRTSVCMSKVLFPLVLQDFEHNVCMLSHRKILNRSFYMQNICLGILFDGPPKQVVLLISLISHDSQTVSAVTSDSSVICTGIILILIGHHSFISYMVWLLLRFSRLFVGSCHRHIFKLNSRSANLTNAFLMSPSRRNHNVKGTTSTMTSFHCEPILDLIKGN